MRSYSTYTLSRFIYSLITLSYLNNLSASSFHFRPSLSSTTNLSLIYRHLSSFSCSFRCNASNFNSHSTLFATSVSTLTFKSSSFPYKSAITACR